MRKFGWIEGKNIAIEYRFAEQKTERLPELAAELVRLKVDLIVASGIGPALAAKKATSTIPIVMANSSRPCGSRSGCQLGAAGRQCHRALGFSTGAKYQKAGDTQGRNPQARPGWTLAGVGSNGHPIERAQTCGFGAETKIGGNQDSSSTPRA